LKYIGLSTITLPVVVTLADTSLPQPTAPLTSIVALA
jgi:hypothetical protein